MKLKHSILACLSTLLITACDPRFETTTEICSTNQSDVVIIARLNHTVKASDDEYQPYLQDILTALNIPGSVTTDEQAALDTVDGILKRFMPYEIVDGEIQADNALDIIESIIATTDPSTVTVVDPDDGSTRNDSKLIEAFRAAKSQVADGINADDGFCIYSNKNITIRNLVTQINVDTGNKEDVEKNILNAQLTLTYDPFNGTFSQNIIMSQTEKDPNISNVDIQTSFVGFYDTPPNDFKATGFSPPTVRVATINATDTSKQVEKFGIDDDFSKKRGQVEYEVLDDYCLVQKVDTNDDIVRYDANQRNAFIDGRQNILALDGNLKYEIEKTPSDGNILTVNDEFSTINDIDIIVDEITIYLNKAVNDVTTVTTGTETAVTIVNNKIVISLDSINSSILLENNTLTIDGKLQVDDEGIALSILLNTVVYNADNKLLVDDAFIFNVAPSTPVIAINCKDDIITRTVKRNECTGGYFDLSNNKLPNETRKRQIRVFDLNSAHTNLKRVRVETDYTDSTVKLYSSTYREAVYISEEKTDFIEDPTNCEEQAILDFLFNETSDEIKDADGFEGVRLSVVPDTTYDFQFELDANDDIVRDDSGAGVIDENKLPTPAYTLTGTEIPARQ